MNAQQIADSLLRSAGFYVPAHKGSSDLQNEYRVGRHDLIVTVNYDFDDMVVNAQCEEWGFDVQDRFESADDILTWIEAQKNKLDDLIDAD